MNKITSKVLLKYFAKYFRSAEEKSHNQKWHPTVTSLNKSRFVTIDVLVIHSLRVLPASTTRSPPRILCAMTRAVSRGLSIACFFATPLQKNNSFAKRPSHHKCRSIDASFAFTYMSDCATISFHALETPHARCVLHKAHGLSEFCLHGSTE